MFCGDCGKETKAKTKFCVHCGAVLEEPPPKTEEGGGKPPEQEAPAAQPVPLKPKGKGRKNAAIIGVIAALVVIAVVVILVVSLTGGKESGGASKTTPTGKKGSMKFAALQSGTTEALNGVSALDDTHVWVVGGAGTILFYDGSSWKKQESGVTDDLNSVYSLDDTHVWAVGQRGVILFFDGSAWKTQMEPGAARIDYFDGVFAVDETHVWTVGGVIISQDSVVSFYDGSTWKEQDAPGATLHAVFGTATDDMWAVGGLGTAIHYDGTSWTRNIEGLKESGKSVPYLWGIAGSDSEHIWATSNGLVYFFDGTSWNKQGAGSGAQLQGIEISGTGDGWAAGKKGTVVSRSGEAWASEDSDTSVDLFAVAASRDAVWVTGAGGTILKADR